MSSADEEARYRALLSLHPAKPESLEPLVQGLYDESWRVRKAATEQLCRAASLEPLVPRLLQVLADRGQTGARNAAAEVLSRLGVVAAPALVGLLRHDDPDQRKFAADILGEAGGTSAVSALEAALDDPDLNVRASAAEALGRIGGEAATRTVEKLVASPEPLLQLCALQALGALRHAPPLPVLVPLLEDPMLRASAYRLLGLIEQPAAMERICRGLSSEVRSVRQAAFAAVGMQRSLLEGPRRAELEAAIRSGLRGVGELLGLLSQALAHEQLEVRAGALLAVAALRETALAAEVAEAAQDGRLAELVIRTLSRLGPPAGRALLARLPTLSASAQSAAAAALEELADPSLVEPLWALVEGGEPELVSSAVRALGRSRSSAAVEKLAGLLGDSAWAPAAARALVMLAETFRAPVREALFAAAPTSPHVVLALAQVAGTEALPVLKSALRHADFAVRAAAAEAVCEVGGEEAWALAQHALADEAAPVRQAAARALGKLSGAQAASLLKVALGDEDAAVQVAAIAAAGDAGAVDVGEALERLVDAPDGLCALEAVRSLERLGRFTPAALARAVRHPDPEVVKAALAAGAWMPEGVAEAVARLSHPRWDVRAAAARVLGDSGGAESRPHLQEALAREADPLARLALEEAAAKLAVR
ncbi:MAG: HEAT repeat domain-containing protein [Myxococcota bacterium]